MILLPIADGAQYNNIKQLNDMAVQEGTSVSSTHVYQKTGYLKYHPI